MKLRMLPAVIALALAPTLAAATVADSAATGFTYKTTLDLSAPPDTVYQRLLMIGHWWGSSHTFSGDAHNLSIEARPMGCWCEKLPNGGGVRHMQVVNVMPGKLLVLTGGLGPLQAMAATGAMTFRLTAQGQGTKLDITYAVTGYFPGGSDNLSGAVDKVLTEQFTRFKSYVETGSPEPKSATSPK